ncbi:MAG: retropepsin-like aspartic protease [Chloroflexota bacterium]
MTNIFSFDYDNRYFPPAPFVDIEIFSPDTPNNAHKLKAMVDSGADATILPVKVLKKAGAEMLEEVVVRGMHNIGASTWTYLVSLKIGEYTFHQLEVVSSNQPNQILLGRDVLNHLIVTLNGLAGVTEISQ